MNPTRRRAVVVAGLMGASLAGATAWRPTAHLADTRPKVDLETMFPKAFGEWRVDDRMPVQLISPDLQSFLDKIYNQTLSRTYVGPAGQRVMLSVAYGGDQSDATRAHRPEVCYPAQGFQVLSNASDALQTDDQSLRVRRLVAKLGPRTEPITYWIMVGEKAATSGTEQKMSQLAYTLRGLIPDGMLVRISTIESNPAAAFAVHDRFIQQLSRSLPSSGRARVFGVSDGIKLAHASMVTGE